MPLGQEEHKEVFPLQRSNLHSKRHVWLILLMFGSSAHSFMLWCSLKLLTPEQKSSSCQITTSVPCRNVAMQLPGGAARWLNLSQAWKPLRQQLCPLRMSRWVLLSSTHNLQDGMEYAVFKRNLPWACFYLFKGLQAPKWFSDCVAGEPLPRVQRRPVCESWESQWERAKPGCLSCAATGSKPGNLWRIQTTFESFYSRFILWQVCNWSMDKCWLAVLLVFAVDFVDDKRSVCL